MSIEDAQITHESLEGVLQEFGQVATDLGDAYEKMRSALIDLKKELETAWTTLEEMQGDIDTLKEELEETRTERDQQENMRDKMEDERDELQSKVNDLEIQLDDAISRHGTGGR